MNKHPFHIVDASPWPLLGSVGRLCFVRGLVASIHHYGSTLLGLGSAVVVLTTIQ